SSFCIAVSPHVPNQTEGTELRLLRSQIHRQGDAIATAATNLPSSTGSQRQSTADPSAMVKTESTTGLHPWSERANHAIVVDMSVEQSELC
ncbi:unnamed protein product, partial [Linum tenue]